MSDDKSKFPPLIGRPDHRDFWRIAAIVRAMDAESDNAGTREARNASFLAAVSKVADRASLLYIAEQRALRARPGTKPEPLWMALWVEGFLSGAAFKSPAPIDGKEREAAAERWMGLIEEAGFGESQQLDLFEAFLWERGMMNDFVAHCEGVARKEKAKE
jgi:hypothetical protein